MALCLNKLQQFTLPPLIKRRHNLGHVEECRFCKAFFLWKWNQILQNLSSSVSSSPAASNDSLLEVKKAKDRELHVQWGSNKALLHLFPSFLLQVTIWNHSLLSFVLSGTPTKANQALLNNPLNGQLSKCAFFNHFLHSWTFLLFDQCAMKLFFGDWWV